MKSASKIDPLGSPLRCLRTSETGGAARGDADSGNDQKGPAGRDAAGEADQADCPGTAPFQKHGTEDPAGRPDRTALRASCAATP